MSYTNNQGLGLKHLIKLIKIINKITTNIY